MRTLRHLLPLAALLLAPALSAAAQDYTIRAYANPTQVGTDEVVVFTIEVEGASTSDVDTPEPPSTVGLALVQPVPSSHVAVSFVNGRLEQSVSYRWSYRPLRQGTARIGSARVRVGGETYTTDPVRVDVVAQSQRPQARRPRTATPFGQPAPDEDEPEEPPITDRDLFIRTVPSQHRAYQNEQVTVTYELYFREGVQLRHSRLAGSWDAEGFWREEFQVDARPIPRTNVMDHLRYHTITLKRVAVFPTHAGDLRVDPLRIETEAYVPSRSADPFEQFFSLRNRFSTVELSSDPVTIEALPLPPGAPASFNGAVGELAMRVDVDRRQVEVGEPVEVRIRLSGTGNIATLAAPAFEPPGVFEQYDPQIETEIDRNATRIRGSKTFTYILVPRSNGTFELPPVTFSHFDPATAQYVSTRSDPVTLEVTGDAALPLHAGTTADGLPVDDIAGLMQAAEWVPAAGTPLYRQPWAYAVLVLPWLAAAGLLAFRRRTERMAADPVYARSRVAHPSAQRHLKQADALMQQGRPRAFFEEIEHAAVGFVGDRFGLAAHGLTHPQLDERLAARQVDRVTRRELLELLELCDRARFSPAVPSQDEMERARARAARLIAALDDTASRAS